MTPEKRNQNNGEVTHYSGDVKQNTLGTRATKDGPEESNYLAHFLVDFPDYRLRTDTLWERANVIPLSTTHEVDTERRAAGHRCSSSAGLGHWA